MRAEVKRRPPHENVRIRLKANKTKVDDENGQLNVSVSESTDINAQLPVVNGLVLIGLSVLLTLIGGFIPSKQAAKKDPVIALRSE